MEDENNLNRASQDAAHDGWTLPRPQIVPRPTYAPAVVALSIVCLFWGLVTTYLISLLGLLLLAVGIADWIGGLRHDDRP